MSFRVAIINLFCLHFSLCCGAQLDSLNSPFQEMPDGEWAYSDYDYELDRQYSENQKGHKDFFDVSETCAKLFLPNGRGKNEFFPVDVLKKLNVKSCTVWSSELREKDVVHEKPELRVFSAQFVHGEFAEFAIYEGLHTGVALVGIPKSKTQVYHAPDRIRLVAVSTKISCNPRFLSRLNNDWVDYWIANKARLVNPAIIDIYGDIEDTGGSRVTMINQGSGAETIDHLTLSDALKLEGDTAFWERTERNLKDGIGVTETVFSDRYLSYGGAKVIRMTDEIRNDTIITISESNGKKSLYSKVLMDKSEKPVVKWAFDSKGKLYSTEEYTYDEQGRLKIQRTNYVAPVSAEKEFVYQEKKYEFQYDRDGLICQVNCWLDNRGISLLFEYTMQ